MNKAQMFEGQISSVPTERRQYIRIPIAVQIEMKCEGTDVPMRAETSDICQGGCYVEMAMTMATGTMLGIVLWLDQETVTMKGKVVTRHAQFGNGIQFLEMSPETDAKLSRFLDAQCTSDNAALIGTRIM